MSELEKILAKPSLLAAPLLIGWRLVRDLPAGRVSIEIVETEAYHQDDPASHSFRGRTMRTAPMFEVGGHIYVYFTYGMHYCVNIVVGPAGRGEAVLLRAGQPLEGIEILKANRSQNETKNLTNGPAKLAQALGIVDTSLSGKKLGRDSFWLEPQLAPISKEKIVVGQRIGISRAVDVEARFYLKDNHFVSKL